MHFGRWTVPAYIPVPAAPVNSNLVFAGWVDSNGNAVTEFQENTTYYANWSYGSAGETNSISRLQYLIYTNSAFFDLRGSGGLKTTFNNNGYDLRYKYKIADNSVDVNSYITSFNGSNATYSIANNIYYPCTVIQ